MREGSDGFSGCNPQIDMDEEEEEEEEALHFSGQDLMKIRDAIVLLVQSLLRLLHTFPLKDRPQSACNCTQVTRASVIPLLAHPCVSVCQLLLFFSADLQ